MQVSHTWSVYLQPERLLKALVFESRWTQCFCFLFSLRTTLCTSCLSSASTGQRLCHCFLFFFPPLLCQNVAKAVLCFAKMWLKQPSGRSSSGKTAATAALAYALHIGKSGNRQLALLAGYNTLRPGACTPCKKAASCAMAKKEAATAADRVITRIELGFGRFCCQ